jgi:hypothetical protein
MVKSPVELIAAFNEDFDLERKIVLDDDMLILFGRAK